MTEKTELVEAPLSETKVEQASSAVGDFGAPRWQRQTNDNAAQRPTYRFHFLPRTAGQTTRRGLRRAIHAHRHNHLLAQRREELWITVQDTAREYCHKIRQPSMKLWGMRSRGTG